MLRRLCYDVSVRLSMTEVHWRIIANLGFKFTMRDKFGSFSPDFINSTQLNFIKTHLQSSLDDIANWCQRTEMFSKSAPRYYTGGR